jgi:hypothetical protein
LYWHWRDPKVLDLMRSANFPASLALYGMCGLLWYYEGRLRDWPAQARAWWHQQQQG